MQQNLIGWMAPGRPGCDYLRYGDFSSAMCEDCAEREGTPMKPAILIAFILALACHAQARKTAPDVVIRGTLSALGSEGLVQTDDVDQSKTWSEEIASERHKDTSRKIFFVNFRLRDGREIRAIADWHISKIPERSGLVVYVISQVLQEDGKPTPPHHE